MNVSMTKTGDVSARLTVNVTEADYQEKVNKELKKINNTHAIPGFRKGHVPAGELRRRFGMSVTSDVINEEVYRAVVDYLRDNKVDILGEPLPVEIKELDLKNNKDFTFEYDLALSPALDIKIDKEMHVPFYTIKIEDKMVEDLDNNMRRRYGAQVPGEKTEPGCVIKGVMMQLNEDGNVNDNEGAIQVTNAIISPEHFTSKEEAAKFDDKAVGDKVVFNPAASCDGNPAELASMLNIDRSIAADVKSDFEFAISEIIVVKPAELNAEYFENFGKDKVTDEESYRNYLREIIARDLHQNSELLFRRDAQKELLDKYGDMKFADDLLKRWLINRNDGLNAENIDEEYQKMLPGLKWEMISNRIAEQNDLKITDESLLGFAKQMAAGQFASYGMRNLDDEIVTNYAKQMLGDKNYRQRLVSQMSEIMIFNAIQNLVTLDKKEVTVDEFSKLAENA